MGRQGARRAREPRTNHRSRGATRGDEAIRRRRDGWYDGQHRHHQAQVGERHIFPSTPPRVETHTSNKHRSAPFARLSTKKRRHHRTTNNTTPKRQIKHNKSTVSTYTAPRGRRTRRRRRRATNDFALKYKILP